MKLKIKYVDFITDFVLRTYFIKINIQKNLLILILLLREDIENFFLRNLILFIWINFI
jgi:hypothetical protein